MPEALRKNFLAFAQESLKGADTEGVAEPDVVEHVEEHDPETEETQVIPEQPEEVVAEEVETEQATVTEEEEEVDSAPLTPELQKVIDKRIGKEVGKRKALEEQLTTAQQAREQLETELQTLKSGQPQAAAPVATAANPLAGIHSPQQLQQKADEAEGTVALVDNLAADLEADPDAVEAQLRQAGVKLTNKSGEEDYSPGNMKRYLLKVKGSAEAIVRKHVPARQQFLQQVGQNFQETLKVMPELNDVKSPRHKMALEISKAFPTIMENPNWPRLIAAQVFGMEQLEKSSKPAAPATTVKKKPVPPQIPTPKAQPIATRKPGKGEVDADTIKKGIQGDKESRESFLKSALR